MAHRVPVGPILQTWQLFYQTMTPVTIIVTAFTTPDNFTNYLLSLNF